MARLKDPTKPICELEALDFTLYDKGQLNDYSSRLATLVKEINKTINQYDYQQELKELKKKYNITD